ncbi:MAG: 50S ribosomal protein L27, partial [bacterium]|nr:50S ribosomal protein L27 [bacterium]
IHAGDNVGRGGDDTLFATSDGTVHYGSRRGRKLVDVVPA